MSCNISKPRACLPRGSSMTAQSSLAARKRRKDGIHTIQVHLRDLRQVGGAIEIFPPDGVTSQSKTAAQTAWSYLSARPARPRRADEQSRIRP